MEAVDVECVYLRYRTAEITYSRCYKGTFSRRRISDGLCMGDF